MTVGPQEPGTQQLEELIRMNQPDWWWSVCPPCGSPSKAQTWRPDGAEAAGRRMGTRSSRNQRWNVPEELLNHPSREDGAVLFLRPQKLMCIEVNWIFNFQHNLRRHSSCQQGVPRGPFRDQDSSSSPPNGQ